MISLIRRGLMLACVIGLLSTVGCRDEEVPSTSSTEPNMDTNGTDTPGS